MKSQKRPKVTSHSLIVTAGLKVLSLTFAVLFLAAMMTTPARAESSPQIAFTSIPPYGSNASLSGIVTGVAPGDYYVTIMINISGLGAYTKPYCDITDTNAIPVPIQSDGSWTTPIDTGGVDSTAVEIGAYLLPQSASPTPCYFRVDGFPAALKSTAVSSVFAKRPTPTQITFSNTVFDVKTNTVPLSPGCLFSDSPENVWVDDQGRLHLKITNRDGGWQCAEIYTEKALNYGDFTFTIENSPCSIDPTAVLGLFTYNELDSSYANREIDIEFSKFGVATDTNCEQFVVQPYGTAGHLMRFPFTAGSSSQHSFQWSPGQVQFTAADPAGNLLKQWNDTTDIPPAGGQGLRLNLWYSGGTPTSEVEVIVDSFQYVSSEPAHASVFQNGAWVIDSNDNGVYDGPTIDSSFYFGAAGDIPFLGDWNGDGRQKVGVFHEGLWILDLNGNGQWDGPGIDSAFYFGQPSDTPIIGDWNGDGRTKVGVFRAGLWLLDSNGNGQFDDSGPDVAAYFGQPEDTPIVGDWSGDGRTKIGTFNAGLWVLDWNGNAQWDGLPGDTFFYFGQSGDIPMIGDWNNDGRMKVGTFNSGLWLLDYNGNQKWDSTPTDRYFYLGQAGDIPLVGDWNGDARGKAAIFRNGLWVADLNGNGQWDGAPPDAVVSFGQSGDIPVLPQPVPSKP